MSESGGRPTLYKEEYDRQAHKLALLGATVEEIADFFGVATSTVFLWLTKHESFSEAVKSGRMVADSEVAASLYKRATGFEFTETKQEGVYDELGEFRPERVTQTQKYTAPETAAAFIWLKNRQPDKWRNKPEASQEADPEQQTNHVLVLPNVSLSDWEEYTKQQQAELKRSAED